MINVGQARSGATVFHILCQTGHLNCLKYLLFMEKHYKTKIDTLVKSKSHGANGLIFATLSNDTQFVHFLLDNVYNDNNTFNINDSSKSGNTPLFNCSSQGNLSCVKKIISKFEATIQIDKCNKEGRCPFYVSCKNNHFDVIKWFLTNKLMTKNRIEFNLQDKGGFTPLMTAIHHGNEQSVSLLLESPQIMKKVLGIRNSAGYNALDIAVMNGHLSIFAKIVLKLFEKFQITNFKHLNECRFFNEKKIVLWLDWCSKRGNLGLWSYLTNLYEKGVRIGNFSYIYGSLLIAKDKETAENENQLFVNYNVSKLNEMRCNHLLNNLSNGCKNELFDTVISVMKSGILKQECCFDDVCYCYAKNIIQNNLKK